MPTPESITSAAPPPPKAAGELEGFQKLAGLGLSRNLLRASHPQTSTSPYFGNKICFWQKAQTALLVTSELAR